MKKKFRFLTTIFLILTLAFGSVFTVSAKESNEILDNLNSYFSLTTEFTAVCSNDSEDFPFSVDRIKVDTPKHFIYLETPNSSYESGYQGHVFLVSESSTMRMGHSFLTSDKEHIDSTLEGEIEFYDVNYWSFTFTDTSNKKWYIYEFGLFLLPPVEQCNIPRYRTEHTGKEFLNLLFTGTLTGDDVESLNPVINNEFYFKNVGYSVRAENSSEYPDETFIKFTWDTDNLQDGDLLEIKTRNHYTKIGGDQVIGFHDYITTSDNVDCFSGSYEMSQTDAVKAWFATVEGKPLVFKDYDTDMYFLRPVRGNQLGLWVRITMGRKTPTSSPYIKDIEYGDFTEDGSWIKNEDATIQQGGNHGIDQGGSVIAPDDAENIIELENIGDLFKYLISNLKLLIGYFNELPFLINSVIGWLPTPIIVLICAFIAIVIILRIFGR